MDSFYSFSRVAPLLFLATVAACSSGADTTELEVLESTNSNVRVPDLIGLTEQTAGSNLAAAGLVVGSVTEQNDSSVPAGDVISQNPISGSQIASGAAVNLVVSLGPATVSVPDVAGLDESAAEAAITMAELIVGTITRRNDSLVPTGNVVSQQPMTGSMVGLGTPVDLVVSLGLPTVVVPSVVGSSESQATMDIVAAGLSVGAISQAADNTAPAGDVISQTPDAGFLVGNGTAVNLVISLGTPQIAVPDVAGLTEAQAITAIASSGLSLGMVARQNDPTVPNGNVISQSPLPGTMAVSGADVDIVVSMGPSSVAVPDVSGLTESDAAAELTGAGLILGSVMNQADAAVPAGAVISHIPQAGTLVGFGASVDIVVSLGSAMTPAPDVVGIAEADAINAIDASGLVLGTISLQNDAVVPTGFVISQNPGAGTTVAAGSSVDIVVSLGSASIAVPNVTGLSQSQASSALAAVGLDVGMVTMQNDGVVPIGLVVSQAPPAGTLVGSGTNIDLIISLGIATVAVPDVSGQSQAQAAATIVAANLVVGNVSQQNDNTVPNGSVISQAPIGGSTVSVGSSVDLVISTGPAITTVPNIGGLTQAQAAASIGASNLIVGNVSQQNDSGVPSGSVISQDPAPGVTVLVGSSVNLVVSIGPATTTVPGVVGQPQGQAATNIAAAGLTLGAVTSANDSTAAVGDVLSQNPIGGATANNGSSVDLVVSLGPATTTVPSVVGQSQTQASSAIVAANLVVGTLTTQNDNTVPSGDVISQNPAGGATANVGSNVDLVVSLGAATTSVPSVVGQSQAQASSAIVAANLVVGTVTTQNDNTVPSGDVISQNPAGGATANVGSNVDLVVSLGAATTSVPSVVGQSQAQASSAIVAANLVVGTLTTQNDNTVPSGDVISQNPAGGATANVGSNVDLVVSLGAATTSVPSVVGQSQAQASSAIVAANLVVGTLTTQNDNTVPSGDVISQNPAGGATANVGSSVDLVVSLGAATTTVPSVVGQSQAQASSAIVAANLVVGTLTTQNDNTVPSGDVISQNPAGGATANVGSNVDLVVSLGAATTSVPSVVGQSQAQASSAIVAANLVVGTLTTQNDNTVPSGDVISQNPAGGVTANVGSNVDLVVSLGAATTSVPSVVGQSQAQASSAIVAANLVVGTVTTQNDNTVPSGDVISQNPAGGVTANVGSNVDLVVSLGAATISVPDVVGLSQAQASSVIAAANLVVGTVTQQNDNSVPNGDVISQNPVSASMVGTGSSVDLVVSLGAASVTVPDVVGLSQSQASTAVVTANLVVGSVTQQSDNTVPSGDVISQNPVSGSTAGAGSAVDLVVSSGPASSYSDEFSANSLADWSLRHMVEGTSAQFTTLDINQSTPGHLTIIPTRTPGWFGGGDGPLVFKTVSGNFSVHVRLLADSVSNPGQPPGSNFNSAGIMARNASGASGSENYIMLNIGRQDSRIPTGVGSESKTTLNSNSSLFIDQGNNSGELILCRVGTEFISYRMLDGESSWTQLEVFSRPDMPATLQVGMVVNAFSAPADLRAEFDFVRLRSTPATQGACTP